MHQGEGEEKCEGGQTTTIWTQEIFIHNMQKPKPSEHTLPLITKLAENPYC